MNELSFDTATDERKIFFGDIACNFESLIEKNNAASVFDSMNLAYNYCWQYYVKHNEKTAYPFSVSEKFGGFQIFKEKQLLLSYTGGEGYLYVLKILRDFINGIKGYAY